MSKVYVGGLAYRTTAEQLKRHALAHVSSAEVVVIIDRDTGRSKGFAFIDVPTDADANALISGLHGQVLEERTVIVNFAIETGIARKAVAEQTVPIAECQVLPDLGKICDIVSGRLVEYFSRHPDEMKRLDPRKFKELIAEIWEKLHYEVYLQPDGDGIDVIAVRHAEADVRHLIKCARLNQYEKIGVAPVRELLGLKHHLGGTKAILATTVYFTPEAQELLDVHRYVIEGRDYDRIVAWLNMVCPPATGTVATFSSGGSATALHSTATVGAPRSAPTATTGLQSVYLSYGAADEPFVERLFQALEARGVATFYFPEHAPAGQKLHRTSRVGVNQHDRVLFVCSRASLSDPRVQNELDQTLEREAREGGSSRLIPVNLDNFARSPEWKPPHPDVIHEIQGRVMVEMVGVEGDAKKFEQGIERLIRALKG